MFAALELLADLFVTGRAVDLALNRLARTHSRGIHVGVALAARNLGVPRSSDIDDLDEHRPSVFGLQLLAAMATHAVSVGHALGIKERSNFMGLVAVGTRREDMCLLFPEFAPDRFAVNYLDLRVTLGASRGDILARNRRLRIRMWQYGVRRVTGCAIRRHDQALLEQRLAMDALGIVLQDVVLWDVAILGDLGTFAMTSAANEGYLQRRNR